MHLSETEVKRFYTIWFQLLHFVNQKEKLVGSFPKEWGNARVSPDMALPLRNALWSKDSLREAFLAENPGKLSQDDLKLVESWKHRVANEFFIVRHLKKYTVFVDEESPPTGYAVHGIASSLEEITGPYLPIYVRTVLLPYEDRIIYDSLLEPYSLYFGSGIKRDLNDTYRDIQERGGLVTQLPPTDTRNNTDQIRVSNKKVLVAFQKALGAAGLTPKMIEEHHGNLERFASEFLMKQSPPILLVDTTQKEIEAYWKKSPKDKNSVSFKRFVWFLRDTARIAWEDAEGLLDFLKQK